MKDTVKVDLIRIMNKSYESGQGNGRFHAVKHLMVLCKKFNIKECSEIIDSFNK